MKRLSSFALCLLLGALAAGAQGTGFGSAGAAGILFQGGDPAQLTQRIMSTTRYKLTPGDIYQLAITMQGTSATFSLVLQENYDLQVPNMETVNARGMYFADLRKMITDRLKQLYRNAEFVSLTLQSPARFDITVFGGVLTPGTVTVNATQRVTDALILAGRRVAGATYRTIALVRGDSTITVDLVRYGLEGASELNPFLEPGDRIIVPPAGLMVTLAGQVRYPGTFEMIKGETLGALVAYAGGMLPDADGAQVDLARFAPDGSMSRRTLSAAADAGTVLTNGDRVRIPSLIENTEMVLVTGAVFGAPVSTDRPVPIPLIPIAVNVPYAPGLSLLQVLEALGGPTPYADGRNATLLRKATRQSMTVDVEALWASKDPAKDIVLEPGDAVSIPIVNQVFVAGEVFSPGKVPYDPSLRVSDYLIASGGVNPLTGDPNSLWFVDKLGRRTRAGLASPVAPGTVILVDQNAWTQTKQVLADVGIITGFIGGIVALLAAVLDLYNALPP